LKESLFHYVYHLMDNVTMTPQFTPEEFERACTPGSLLCYEPNFDQARFQPLVDAFAGRLKRFEVVNSQEMRCYECVSPKS